jgi:hypothetical protein
MDVEAALEKSNRRLLCLCFWRESRVHVASADQNHVTCVFVFDELLLACCIAWNFFATATDRHHTGLPLLVAKPLLLLAVACYHFSVDRGISHASFDASRVRPALRYAFVRM